MGIILLIVRYDYFYYHLLVVDHWYIFIINYIIIRFVICSIVNSLLVFISGMGFRNHVLFYRVNGRDKAYVQVVIFYYVIVGFLVCIARVSVIVVC